MIVLDEKSVTDKKAEEPPSLSSDLSFRGPKDPLQADLLGKSATQSMSSITITDLLEVTSSSLTKNQIFANHSELKIINISNDNNEA